MGPRAAMSYTTAAIEAIADHAMKRSQASSLEGDVLNLLGYITTCTGCWCTYIVHRVLVHINTCTGCWYTLLHAPAVGAVTIHAPAAGAHYYIHRLLVQVVHAPAAGSQLMHGLLVHITTFTGCWCTCCWFTLLTTCTGC